MVSSPTPAAIDPRRYRKVLAYFSGLATHLVFFDLVLGLPGIRRLRPDPVARWTRLAQRYRGLAVELGGVLIKLGQYMSTRVDVLPLPVARELAGLQDEVPALPFSAIAGALAADLGRPLAEVFLAVEPVAVGAASLAQAHKATLLDGREVVVKVLRPGIEVLVETDLKAIGVAVGWLEHLKFIRERVDLEWLIEEFTATTRRELDLAAEGKNAERFAACFANDPQVAIPAIFWHASGHRTLTEENVAGIKVNDLAGLEAAGIRPAEVARVLYRIYMEQIFVHNFVHADPHPGNLFVRPTGPAVEGHGRPFEVAFVDFGMVAVIPERLRAALREFIIGFGTRDAGRVVAALANAGVLLPGADLEELEAAAETVFNRFWGVSLGDLTQFAKSEALALLGEFGRLALETPIQVPADLLFVLRAVELLAPLALSLDPELDPWAESMPFARRLAMEDGRRSLLAWAQELLGQGKDLLELPGNLARVVGQAGRGRLVVRTALATDTRRRLHRLERLAAKLTTTVAAGALVIAGAVLLAGAEPAWLGWPFLGAGLLAFLWAAAKPL